MVNSQQKWFAVEISADAAVSEAIEFALGELDALGTEINNLGKNQLPTLKIVGYFNELPAHDVIDSAVADALGIYGFSTDAVHGTSTYEVENQDWLAEWKKHWKPTVTARFVIAPLWETVEATDKFVIRIEPSMAFGTGTHETTKLCVKAIEDNYDGKMSFFDVGTGTGILAIAAKKLCDEAGASPSIVGCDTDVDSIKIAIENAELNDAANARIYVGSIGAGDDPFEFVCANLTADVIVPILPLLVEKSTRFLVLSGILKTQEDLVTTELERLVAGDFAIEQDGEWISVVVQRGQ